MPSIPELLNGHVTLEVEFRPAVAMFTSNDAVLPFPLRASLNRVDAQLDELIYQAFPQAKAS